MGRKGSKEKSPANSKRFDGVQVTENEVPENEAPPNRGFNPNVRLFYSC